VDRLLAHAAPEGAPPPAPESSRPKSQDQDTKATRTRIARWIAVPWAAAGVCALASALAPRLPIEPVAAYAIGFCAVFGSAIATSVVCPPLQRRALWMGALPILLLWVLAQLGGADVRAAAVVTIALLLCGTCLGSVVGTAIEHPGHLVFVAIVSAASDAASVFHPSGPSAAIAQSARALSLLALPWPMLGTDRIEPFLGVGDVVFTALYIASTRRHGLPLWRTLLGLTLGYLVTMVTVVGLEATVPALPFLGLGVVLAQPEARRPPPRDRVRGYALAAVVVGVVAVLLLR
jgi:hypothetical protein